MPDFVPIRVVRMMLPETKDGQWDGGVVVSEGETVSLLDAGQVGPHMSITIAILGKETSA